MNIQAQVEKFRHFRRNSAWELLAFDLAPIALAILHNHLGLSDKKLPTAVLAQKIHYDLKLLRSQGFQLPQTSQAYLAQWLANGFLEREFPEGESEEYYELSFKAHQAIRFALGMIDGKSVATESRLLTVMQSVAALAQQTDQNQQNRITQLRQEKQRIDAEIAKIEQGQAVTLDDDQALERLQDTLHMAEELVSDFRQLGESFKNLDLEFRKKIVESQGSRGDVLEALFNGVDVIANSDAGRTFKAFWRLLTDSTQNLAFETAIDGLLARSFSTKLTKQQRYFLMQLTRILLQKGQEVHQASDLVSRKLRQFVQQQGRQKQKILSQQLDSLERQAINLKDRIKPTKDLGFSFDLTGIRISSLTQWQLFDPEVDQFTAEPMVQVQGETDLTSITDLVENAEIDFLRLKTNIADALQRHRFVSIGQLLKMYPVVQGLGTVMGYISLAKRFGQEHADEERLEWYAHGAHRSAMVIKLSFNKTCLETMLHH